MLTRVLSVQAQLDKLDEAIAICQSLEPLWQQQRGFRHADLLVDRSTGKVLSLSTSPCSTKAGSFMNSTARFCPIRRW